jgi:arabinose-5-phosphate isomerase
VTYDVTWDGLLLETVDTIISQNPGIIRGDTLASAAMEVMQAQKATVLFVVDESWTPSGILHIHDLLRAGVA